MLLVAVQIQPSCILAWLSFAATLAQPMLMVLNALYSKELCANQFKCLAALYRLLLPKLQHLVWYLLLILVLARAVQ